MPEKRQNYLSIFSIEIDITILLNHMKSQSTNMQPNVWGRGINVWQSIKILYYFLDFQILKFVRLLLILNKCFPLYLILYSVSKKGPLRLHKLPALQPRSMKSPASWQKISPQGNSPVDAQVCGG